MKILSSIIIIIFMLSSCSNKSNYQEDVSYKLGGISAFSEMINAGVKKMALSATMTTDQMNDFLPLAEEVAVKHNVNVYREKDLLVSKLFPEDVAKDLEVLVLYQGTTKDQYLELKKEKENLLKNNKYDESAQIDVSRRFGRLLSYSPKKINKLLSENTSFRTMADFGIKANSVFLYYDDMEAAGKFYSELLGMEIVAEYDNAILLRMSPDSYLILVDAAKGMHDTTETKSVALALLTDNLKGWYEHFQKHNIPIKYSLKSKDGSAHDGFVAVDPEGYLLEIERFNAHPENENFIPILELNKKKQIKQSETNKLNENLNFYSSITWAYHKDVMMMEHYYQDVLGLELVADQGWAKIYQVSNTGFLGIVDEKRGMNNYSDEKSVNLGFILDDLNGWFEYAHRAKPFELKNEELGKGPESKYEAFVGMGPEKYYYEFDIFNPHSDNELLIKYLGEK